MEEEIRSGRLQPTRREERVRELVDSQQGINQHGLLHVMADKVTTLERMPGKPEVIDALLGARTTKRVCKICADAFVTELREVARKVKREIQIPNWPVAYGSMLPAYLSQYAAEIIAAKKDGRFPKSARPSSRRRKLWFLSCALAGALYGVAPRTAINLVGSTRPEKHFEKSRAAKAVHKTRKKKM